MQKDLDCQIFWWGESVGPERIKMSNKQISLEDLINQLRSIGEMLAGDEYIKASEEVEMGKSLIEMADALEKHGIK
jgi:hypothetical protein